MSKVKFVVAVLLASTVSIPSTASAQHGRAEVVSDRCVAAGISDVPALVGSTGSCLRLQACSYWVPDLFGGLVPAASDCTPMFCNAVTMKGPELEEFGISDCSPPKAIDAALGAIAQGVKEKIRSTWKSNNKDAPSMRGIYVFGYKTVATPCGRPTRSLTYRQSLMFRNSKKSRTVSLSTPSKVKLSISVRTGLATLSYPKAFVDQVTRPSTTYSWMVPGQTQGTVVWSPGQVPAAPVNPTPLPIIMWP